MNFDIFTFQNMAMNSNSLSFITRTFLKHFFKPEETGIITVTNLNKNFFFNFEI